MPQGARLSAGGGCNCYLGNAQIEVETSWKGLPLQLTLHLTGTLESAAYISHDWCYKFSQVGAGSPRQQWLSGQLSIFTLRGIPHRVSWNCRSYLRQIPSTSPNQTNHLATFLWRESKVRQQWPFLQMLAGIRNHRLEGWDLTFFFTERECIEFI